MVTVINAGVISLRHYKSTVNVRVVETSLCEFRISGGRPCPSLPQPAHMYYVWLSLSIVSDAYKTRTLKTPLRRDSAPSHSTTPVRAPVLISTKMFLLWSPLWYNTQSFTINDVISCWEPLGFDIAAKRNFFSCLLLSNAIRC